MKPEVLERLREIHDEASSEVYADRLNFQEVGTRDFVFWLQNCPMELGFDIMEFDIESAGSLFEEWVKGPRP